MTHSELNQLRDLAQAATPGPWRVCARWGASQEVARVNNLEVAPPDSAELAHCADDAAYIAAVSPDVVLGLIDEVERSHDGFLCSMKFIAFNVLFCGVRLPQRRQFYVQRYECRMEEATTGRGFMQEVELASWNAANPHPNPRVEIAPLDGD